MGSSRTVAIDLEREMRTFIAIELPDDVAQELARRQARLRAHLEQAGHAAVLRWAGLEKFHLTLRFLGPTSEEQSRRVAASLESQARQLPPFALSLAGIGTFPNRRRMRVLWAGIGGDVERLRGFQAEVEAIVQSCDFPPEKRGFSPHITLARVQRGATPDEIRAAGAALPEPDGSTGEAVTSWTVTRVTFMRSELLATGARYSVLARMPLGGGE